MFMVTSMICLAMLRVLQKLVVWKISPGFYSASFSRDSQMAGKNGNVQTARP